MIIGGDVAKDSTVDSQEKESLIFFFHPDHLGSTSYVTGADGTVAQHVEYIPYGEVFVEERSGTVGTAYLFNAKELDDETGMYYYGARYLDPVAAMWISVDPMWEKFAGMSAYNYCGGNPVKMVDPDGRESYMFVETEGTGHAFVVVSDDKGTTAYNYGRYQGGDIYTLGATGDGVLLRLDGDDASDYITTELYKMNADAFLIKDANDASVRQYFDDMYESSNISPTSNSPSVNKNGKVVDTYSLFGNNCTTKSCNAIKQGGSSVFDVNGLLYDYDEDFTIPSSLCNFLNDKSSNGDNVVKSTQYFKNKYNNNLSKHPLKSPGVTGFTSGISGQGAGASANTSSTCASSSGNGSGSFGSGSNSSSSQDYN